MKYIYPLKWPAHIRRRPAMLRSESRYKKLASGSNAGRAIAPEGKSAEAELEAIDAVAGFISCDVPLKVNGEPRVSSEPVDPGVVLYFRLENEEKVICCDRYNTVYDNLHSIVLTLNKLRALERHGCSDVLASAFAGFKALPGQASLSTWRQVLGIPESADLAQAKKAYRGLALQHYGQDLMYSINQAWEDAQSFFGVREEASVKVG